ncbi:MAG: lipopolysaccharide biosynthesis protein [Alistipes sp.]|nr:lipopolysaccharide biosynthesis protein [Alistipes sp.]
MGGELRQRVASSVAWSLGEKIASMLLQAGVSIVVLRMLTPDDMGIMAIPTVLVALALVVVDSGFSQTLIRMPAPSERDYGAVFRFNVVVSLALYAALVAAMPWVARFYGMALLTRIAPVLFLLLPLNALCVIPNTIFTRRFRFASLSKIVFASTFAGGAVAVGMACGGCGIWSLVGQRVTTMGVKALLLWRAGGWRPRAAADWHSLRAMAPFSLRLLATDLIAAVYNNVSQLFVGKLYPVDRLGFFNQAQKLKDLSVGSTMQAVQSVTFPALSAIAGDRAKFAESYRQVVMIVAFVMFPVTAGLIVVASDMFAALLGEKWMPIVPYFRTIALSGFFAPIASVAYNVLKVHSDGGVIVRLEVLKKAVMTLVLAATIPWGVLALTGGLAAMTFFEMAVNFEATTRYAGLTCGRFLRTLLPVASVTAAMAAAVCAVRLWVPLAPLPALLLQAAVGVLCYVGMSRLFRLEAWRTTLEIVKKLVGR